jgi:hypothetical protein
LPSFLICLVAAAAGSVLWSVTFRCAQPLADWLVSPLGKPGGVTLVVASSLSMFFLASIAFSILMGLALFGQPNGVSSLAARKMVLVWSMAGYLLIVFVGSIEHRIKRKMKSKR